MKLQTNTLNTNFDNAWECKLIILSNFHCIHSCCLNLFSCQICFFVYIYYSCMHICVFLYIHVTLLYYILVSFQEMLMFNVLMLEQPPHNFLHKKVFVPSWEAFLGENVDISDSTIPPLLLEFILFLLLRFIFE